MRRAGTLISRTWQHVRRDEKSLPNLPLKTTLPISTWINITNFQATNWGPTNQSNTKTKNKTKIKHKQNIVIWVVMAFSTGPACPPPLMP
jgi:hypothetical protein